MEVAAVGRGLARLQQVLLVAEENLFPRNGKTNTNNSRTSRQFFFPSKSKQRTVIL